MDFNLPNKKKSIVKSIGEIRKSHIITHSGPGAIVDMPDYSVVMAAIDYWSEADKNIDDGFHENVLHEMNLERLLRVSYFREPDMELEEAHKKNKIPAFRFPVIHYCPECGRLMRFYDFEDPKKMTCLKCNKKIIPSRFIAICEDGHMQDFPYKWWVHRGNQCPKSEKPRLKIEFSKTIGTLKGIKIKCEDCGAERTMEDALSEGALVGCRCFGNRPWIGYGSENQESNCDQLLKTAMRTASNIYFPKTINALTIPPWSYRLNQEVEKKQNDIINFFNKMTDSLIRRTFLEALFKDLIDNNTYTLDEILEHAEIFVQSKNNKKYTIKDIKEDEYKVLCKDEYVNETDIQYRRIGQEVPKILKPYIKQIGKVKRLREVMCLYGFNRLKAKGMLDKHASLSKDKLDWLPAIEMLGEGIFIELDEDALKKWEAQNSSRYKTLQLRLEKLKENGTFMFDNFSPRYVLLHTLSHLLIRQLTFECGYSGASIKERIYSSYPDSEINMAGILLYTASTDSDGSLGGLARQTDSIENIFLNMLEDASWCSSDPICSDSTSQGYESLNYSACHACTLLPETCCESMNCLLDRLSIVGRLENRNIGFFGDLLK